MQDQDRQRQVTIVLLGTLCCIVSCFWFGVVWSCVVFPVQRAVVGNMDVDIPDVKYTAGRRGGPQELEDFVFVFVLDLVFVVVGMQKTHTCRSSYERTAVATVIHAAGGRLLKTPRPRSIIWRNREGSWKLSRPPSPPAVLVQEYLKRVLRRRAP